MIELKTLPQSHCNETVIHKDYPDDLQQCSRAKPLSMVVANKEQDWKCWQHKKKGNDKSSIDDLKSSESKSYSEQHEESRLRFVWKLSKNNFKWTNKEKTKGTMRFANEELMWYIGTEDEIDKRYSETKDYKYRFCVTDFIVIILKNPNLNNDILISGFKSFIQKALDEAEKQNIGTPELNEWWMYKKGIANDLSCPECNYRMKSNRYGVFHSKCEGKITGGQSGYRIDCDAILYHTWEDNGMFKNIFYAVDLKKREIEEEYREEQRKKKRDDIVKLSAGLKEQVKLTNEQLKEQVDIHQKTMDMETLSKEEFEKADEITKHLALEHYKAKQFQKISLQIAEQDFKMKRETTPSLAHDPVVDQKTEIKDDDELYATCKLYIQAVVDMYGFVSIQGAEVRRSKYHKKLSELSGLSEIHIAGASTMLDSTIGFPSVELTGGPSKERLKVIVIDYGHKLYRWLLREKRRLKK